MFAHAVPPPPTVSADPPTAAGAPGQARPSRLRGLSYLRNYTQNHLSLHHQGSSPASRRISLTRSTSHPATLPGHDQAADDSAPLSHTNTWETTTNRHTRAETEDDAAESATPSSEPPAEQTGRSDMARRRAGSSQTASQPSFSRRGASSSSTVAPAAGIGTASSYANHEVRSSSRTPRTNAPNVDGPDDLARQAEASNLSGIPHDQNMPTIKFIPHHDARASKPSLMFIATSRTLPHEDCVIRVGRYSERDGYPNPPTNVPSSAPVGFKSKVVSRRHCEFWCSQGQWYIKDVKSSSGTFLNHIRLSQASVESRPFPVNDGDVVQLGIDFRGGEEQIFRCVKIRVEVNRGWQKRLNNFNVTQHKQIGASSYCSECSICLMRIQPCQSLFVAPCSHVWHYKCIRPILNDPQTWPNFLCPNCRAVSDLDAEVDEDTTNDWDDTADLECSHRDQGLRSIADASGHEDVIASTLLLSLDNVTRNRAHSSNLLPTIDLESAAAEPTEGPLTPRNEAGPFVFDGSAGRQAGQQAGVIEAADTLTR